MILPYQEIKEWCQHAGLVYPAVERSEAFGMSFGYSSCGYDVRVAQSLWVPSGGFTLASTIEHFTIPYDILPMVVDKSTWARQGLSVYNTVGEPGWRGYLTLELANHHPYNDIQILEGMPICQIIFMRLTSATQKPYTGKYQNQPNRPVEAILEERSS